MMEKSFKLENITSYSHIKNDLKIFMELLETNILFNCLRVGSMLILYYFPHSKVMVQQTPRQYYFIALLST